MDDHQLTETAESETVDNGRTTVFHGTGSLQQTVTT